MKLALLGSSISHSRSPEIYKKLLGKNISYTLLDYAHRGEVPSLDDIFDKFELDGLNITAPFKSLYFEEVTLERQLLERIGGINCIKRKKGGYLGENTDELAFRSEFIRIQNQNKFDQIIILGNGTMATMINLVLEDFPVERIQFYRSRDGDLSNLNPVYEKGKKYLMINTCARSFIYRGSFASEMIFWDMNYKMTEHENMISGYIDGEELLFKQARHAVEFFNRS